MAVLAEKAWRPASLILTGAALVAIVAAYMYWTKPDAALLNDINEGTPVCPAATAVVASRLRAALHPMPEQADGSLGSTLTTELEKGTRLRSLRRDDLRITEGVAVLETDSLFVVTARGLVFELDEQSIVVHGEKGARWRVHAPARLSGVHDEPYTVSLPAGTKLEVLEPGHPTELRLLERHMATLAWEKGAIALAAVDLGEARPYLAADEKGSLRADMMASTGTATRLGAVFRKAGYTFEAGKLKACARHPGGIMQTAIVDSVKARNPGEAEVEILVPDEALPSNVWPASWVTIAAFATDGSFFAADSVVVSSLPWCFVAAVLFTLLVVSFADRLATTGTPVEHPALPVGATTAALSGSPSAALRAPTYRISFWGLFIGHDGEPSLSLFQIWLWTIVTIFAVFFVFFRTGNMLAVTWEVMALLGITGAGSLGARFAAIKGGSTFPLPIKAPPTFYALVQTDGQPDIYKVQMLLFTVIIALYVAARVVADQAFPELSDNLLLLMGVTNGIYVGSKAITQSPQAPLTHVVAGQPASGAVIFRHVFTRNVRLPQGASLSRAVAGVAATAPSAFALLKNGTAIGEIQFPAGEAAASFSVAAAVDFAAGDVLAIAAPDPQDATLADIAFTLVFGLL